MQELRLVAVSEDGSYAVLTVPGRSGRFALPIDERLRTVARGQFSRLAQYDIEVESPLRPKEIQDRIRAGETAEEIADTAGLPVERIRRFEGPVLAEREFRAGEAQRATVRSPGESGFGPRLSEVVTERLADFGTGPEDQEWDSRKRQDGNWQVQLAYTVSGRMYVAEWVFDPRNKHVTPADDEAIRLSLDESEWPGPRTVSSAGVKATVTPIGSRAAAHPAHPSEQRNDSDRSGGRTIVHPSRQAPAASAKHQQAAPAAQADAEPGPFSGQNAGGRSVAASQVPAAGQVSAGSQVAAASQVTAISKAAAGQAGGGLSAGQAFEAGGKPGSEVQPDAEVQVGGRAKADGIAQAAAGQAAAGQATAADVTSADVTDGADQPDPAAASAQSAESATAQEAPPPAAPEPSARPARRASGGRSRRSSVPSWDEIMFGNSRQPE
jgi:hypothetical protein